MPYNPALPFLYLLKGLHYVKFCSRSVSTSVNELSPNLQYFSFRFISFLQTRILLPKPSRLVYFLSEHLSIYISAFSTPIHLRYLYYIFHYPGVRFSLVDSLWIGEGILPLGLSDLMISVLKLNAFQTANPGFITKYFRLWKGTLSRSYYEDHFHCICGS